MPVEAKIPTRMGDGYMVELTRSELRADLEDATQPAARKAKVPPLTQDELDHLLDIYASRAASPPSTSATRSSSAATAAAAR